LQDQSKHGTVMNLQDTPQSNTFGG